MGRTIRACCWGRRASSRRGPSSPPAWAAPSGRRGLPASSKLGSEKPLGFWVESDEMRSAEREHSQSPRVSGAPAAAFTHTSTVMAIGDGELLRISLCLVESRRGGFLLEMRRPAEVSVRGYTSRPEITHRTRTGRGRVRHQAVPPWMRFWRPRGSRTVWYWWGR